MSDSCVLSNIFFSRTQLCRVLSNEFFFVKLKYYLRKNIFTPVLGGWLASFEKLYLRDARISFPFPCAPVLESINHFLTFLVAECCDEKIRRFYSILFWWNNNSIICILHMSYLLVESMKGKEGKESPRTRKSSSRHAGA